MKSCRDDKIAAVMIGYGQEKPRLKERVEKGDINNVVFLDPVPKKTISSVLSLADCLYIGWKKNPLYRFGICPNKLFDYIMSGKPIIYSVMAPNDWVKDCECGISIEAENMEDLTNAIKRMSNLSEEELIKWGKNGKNIAKVSLNMPI